jgi:hypothetical protein
MQQNINQNMQQNLCNATWNFFELDCNRIYTSAEYIPQQNIHQNIPIENELCPWILC